MIIVLLAEGFEEIEALTPVDILRRCGLDVRTVGVTGMSVKGSHGISVDCDMTPEEVPLSEVSMAIFPGGMPGALNLDAAPFTDRVIEAVTGNGGRLAAICAAPLVFGRRGLLLGKRATCYPGFEKELTGATVSEAGVVTDGNITTAKGMGVSLDFSLELARLLCGEKKAEELSSGVMQNAPKDVPPESDEDRDKRAIEEVSAVADGIVSYYDTVGISLSVESISRGHAVTSYVLKLENEKDGQYLSLHESDISNMLDSRSVRFTENAEGAQVIEVENLLRDEPRLSSILESFEFENAPRETTFVIGASIARDPIFADISRSGNIFVAGGVGGGVTNFISSIALSLAYKADPENLKLLLLDPRGGELSALATLPHLYSPIVEDGEETIHALEKVSDLIDERYALMEKLGVRNIDDYNRAVYADASLGEKMPRLVIISDEYSNLIEGSRDRIEGLLQGIMQKSRAAGIYTVLSTSRISVGTPRSAILGLVGSTACLKISDGGYSMRLLGSRDAEKLCARGDMLYRAMGAVRPLRVKAPYLTDSEAEKICDVISKKWRSI